MLNNAQLYCEIGYINIQLVMTEKVAGNERLSY